MGIETCDLLVINKIDLAPHVGADLEIMERDAKEVRGDKPHVLVNCKTGQGIEQATEHIIRDILFEPSQKLLLRTEKRHGRN